MANRNLTQFAYGFEKMPVQLDAYITIGSTGAATLKYWVPAAGGGGAYASAPTGGYRGIASIARNTTGDYTITLQDTYQRLLGWDVKFQAATTGTAVAPIVSLCTTTTNVATSTGGTVRFKTQSATGTAADPASGEIMYVSLRLSNSSAV